MECKNEMNESDIESLKLRIIDWCGNPKNKDYIIRGIWHRFLTQATVTNEEEDRLFEEIFDELAKEGRLP